MDLLPSVQMKDTETGRHGDAVTRSGNQRWGIGSEKDGAQGRRDKRTNAHSKSQIAPWSD